MLPALNSTALGRNQEKSWILESVASCQGPKPEAAPIANEPRVLLSPITGVLLQPFCILLQSVEVKAGSAGLVPCRKLREILGKQSMDTADGAGAGMLLEPRSDALRGQGEGERQNLGRGVQLEAENNWH